MPKTISVEKSVKKLIKPSTVTLHNPSAETSISLVFAPALKSAFLDVWRCGSV
ncbi:MAG TPA: hypothetical protein VE692_03520 [Nitrososphaera sp.]|nr:hypothetical protein [Nitrososphaera sp.]